MDAMWTARGPSPEGRRCPKTASTGAAHGAQAADLRGRRLSTEPTGPMTTMREHHLLSRPAYKRSPGPVGADGRDDEPLWRDRVLATGVRTARVSPQSHNLWLHHTRAELERAVSR